MKLNYRKFFYYCFFILIISYQACKKDNDDVVTDVVTEKSIKELAKEELLEIMDVYYLWNYNLPEVNLDNYEDPEDLLDALRNEDPFDKWSFVISATEFMQYFDQGESVDHGFIMKFDDQDNVRVAYIFEDAPLYNEGVRRGWKVLEINGNPPWEYETYFDMWGPDEAGVSTTFLFENMQGQEVSITSVKTVYQMNTVMYKQVFDVGGTKVGYLVFDSFNITAEEDLEETFLEFKTEGVNEFILDLRYNSGGEMRITVKLASLLTGPYTDGEVLVTHKHNPNNSAEDSLVRFELQTNSLELSRLFIIASELTASASEVIINGLKPYVDVLVIGDDTHGKPVGMYVFLNEEYDYAYVPICFELVNGNGIGGYYNGLPADAYVYDNVAEPWGSLNEDCLYEALYYIENGSFSLKKTKRTEKNSQKALPVQNNIRSRSIIF